MNHSANKSNFIAHQIAGLCILSKGILKRLSHVCYEVEQS